MLRTVTFIVATGICLALPVRADNWPAFRGRHATGVADASPPVSWDAGTGRGVRWHTPIPGLSHASPIVWGDRAYVLSTEADGAVLDRSEKSAGSVIFATDTVVHQWKLYCLDVATGAVRWSRTVHTGTPRQARHVRGTYLRQVYPSPRWGGQERLPLRWSCRGGRRTRPETRRRNDVSPLSSSA